MNNEKLENEEMDSWIKSLEEPYVQLIRNRLGILIHSHQINNLYKTIADACQKFTLNPNEYLELLSKCCEDSPLIDYLITGITIGETYFFRDKHQMQLLQNVLLPALISAKREQKQLSLRIWSAGCATGEEIFTVAMMLSEMLPDYRAWTIQLLGTDINTQALKKAIAGNYTEWAMRTIPVHYKQKYFEKNKQAYVLSPQICNQASFAYLNLNDNNYPSISNSTNAQDLILCRNVLIYFDAEHTKNLMKKISDCIIPGGFLLLGASDPIDIKGTRLRVHQNPGLYFSCEEKSLPIKVVEKPNLKTTTVISEKIPQTINYQEKKSVKVDKINLDYIEELLSQARWQEILAEIATYSEKERTSIVLANAKATALANLGNLEEALALCQNSLVLDSTNKQTYFIHSLILLELNEIDKAESSLRKALFLDHQFVAAHFRLGMLQLRNKKIKEGLRSLRNALAIAETKDPSELTSEFRGLDFQQIANILRNEIELYSNN
jgi:chemotaxis protein methyltransferase CheR